MVFDEKVAERLESGKRRHWKRRSPSSPDSCSTNMEHHVETKNTGGSSNNLDQGFAFRYQMFSIREVGRIDEPKTGKRPKRTMLEKEIEFLEKKVETRGYVVSANYKGKTPMTRTQ